MRHPDLLRYIDGAEVFKISICCCYERALIYNTIHHTRDKKRKETTCVTYNNKINKKLRRQIKQLCLLQTLLNLYPIN